MHHLISLYNFHANTYSINFFMSSLFSSANTINVFEFQYGKNAPRRHISLSNRLKLVPRLLGVRFQVSGVRCQVSGVRCQETCSVTSFYRPQDPERPYIVFVKNIFLRAIIDELAKSQKITFYFIPAKAGIQ